MPILKFFNRNNRKWEPAGGPAIAISESPQALFQRNTTLANNTTHTVTWDTALRDSGGFWNAGTPTRILIPATGWYLVEVSFSGSLGALGTAGAYYHCNLNKNGAGWSMDNHTVYPAWQFPTGKNVKAGWFVAGDYVEASISNNQSGQTLTYVAQLSITRQAAGQPGPRGPAAQHGRSIGAKVRRIVAQSINHSTDSPLSWSQIDVDTDGFWSAANPTRLTIPAGAPTGLYQLSANIHWPDTSATGQRTARWYNGVTGEFGTPNVTNGGGAVAKANAPAIAMLGKPGDWFAVNLWHDQGGAQNMGGANLWEQATASIAYLGSGSAQEPAPPLAGSWTPGISFNNGTTGITYTIQVGEYVKTGSLVVASFRITLNSNGSSTGTARITGLPFPTRSVGNLFQGAAISYYNGLSGASALRGHSGPAVTTIDLTTGAATGATNLTEANLPDGCIIAGTFSYITD